MHTEEQHRRKGLAKELLKIIKDYAKDNNLKCVKLHASEMGEVLYSSVGFKKWNEMGWVIDWLD